MFSDCIQPRLQTLSLSLKASVRTERSVPAFARGSGILQLPLSAVCQWRCFRWIATFLNYRFYSYHSWLHHLFWKLTYNNISKYIQLFYCSIKLVSIPGAVYHEDLSSEELFRLASLHILVTGLLQEEKSFTSSSEASRSSLKKKPAFPLSKFNLKYVEWVISIWF